MSHFTALVNFSLDNDDQVIEKSVQIKNEYLGYRVEGELEKLLEPFCVDTDNPAFKEFYAASEDFLDEYRNNAIDCVKLPQGCIVSLEHSLARPFCIVNGNISQKVFGQLKKVKKSKKSRKMTALPDYPIHKFYKTLSDYVDDYYGYEFDEDSQAYGYYFNPNAHLDYYTVGGRWPFRFLVKESCTERIIEEQNWFSQNYTAKAPTGYVWVCGAKKKDIEWDAMKDWAITEAKKHFALLIKCYSSKCCPENYMWDINEDGIYSFSNQLYVANESEYDYLTRQGLAPDQRMLPQTYSFLNNGEWNFFGDMGRFGKTIKDWRTLLTSYLDSIPEENFIVGIDCHI